MPNATVTRLAKIRQREHVLIAKIAKHSAELADLHAEECKLLTDALADHGPALGVDAPTMTAASEPKTKPQ